MTPKFMYFYIFGQTRREIEEKPEEELGLSVSSFPNPVREAFSASISTAIGGMIPVSLVIRTLAHFAIGVLKTIVTGRGCLKSGAEVTAVGIIAFQLSHIYILYK